MLTNGMTKEEIEAVVYLTSVTLLDGTKAVVTLEDGIDMVRIVDHESGEQKEYRPLGPLEKQLMAQMIHIRDYRDTNPQDVIRHLPGEPYFVLLGRDPQAPDHAEKWGRDRMLAEPDDWKAPSAIAIAAAMRNYKQANPDVGMSMEAYAIIQQHHAAK